MKSLKISSAPSRRMFLLGGAALGLSACAPAAKAPLGLNIDSAFDAASPARDGAAIWYNAFQDQKLAGLIAQGHARNLDVARAVEAIKLAESGVTGAAAGALPQASASASSSRADQDRGAGVSESSTAGLNVSWVLDIFGANRNAKRAAEARLDASRLSLDAAKLMVEGAIASAYADLRYYQESIALTRRSLESRRKSLELTKTRFEIGDAARLDLLQAEQLVAEGEAQLPNLEIGFDRALARLASLTAGRSADLRPSLQKGGPQLRPRFKASVGVPADVIRARPDVMVSERLYEASLAEIGVAKAAFLPSVRLTGAINASNVVGSGSSSPWSFGPSLNLPIFTAGANRANLSGAQARAAQAHIDWKASVLGAVEEVEVALAAYNRDGRVIASSQKLVDTSRAALEVAQANLSLGEGSFLQVLDAERSYLGAQQGVASAARQRALNFISLSLAAAGRPTAAAA